MRNSLAIALLTAVVTTAMTTAAQAQSIGPVCLTAAETPESLIKLRFISTGGNEFIGTGQEIEDGEPIRPLTASLVVSGQTAMLGLTGPPVLDLNGEPSFSVIARISLATMSGPGRVNLTNCADCDSALTVSVVACPATDARQN
jgi:hypothetical protein